MSQEEFERIVAEEFPNAIPERFAKRIHNVEFLVEDEPSEEVRHLEGLEDGETLLGLYRGISLDQRGGQYGIGMHMPDTITLYRLPLLEEAQALGGGEEGLRRAVRETIWHEVAHYFGFDEYSVKAREEDGSNHSR